MLDNASNIVISGEWKHMKNQKISLKYHLNGSENNYPPQHDQLKFKS